MAQARRTTHRSTAGKKLYAVRDKTGKFEDIQTFERAQRGDIARTSAAEITARKKAAAKKATGAAVKKAASPVKKTTAAAKKATKKR